MWKALDSATRDGMAILPTHRVTLTHTLMKVDDYHR